METVEADHAKVDQIRMARDVSVMFYELKALADRYAELHTDRARLQAELDQARAELQECGGHGGAAGLSDSHGYLANRVEDKM
jgi:hypothetical protein